MSLKNSSVRSNLRFGKKNDAPVAGRNWDFFKVFGAVITTVGIFAWLAGQSYWWGYWSEAGFDTPPVSQSLQVTAFFGFALPIWTWVYTVPTLIGFGVYILILGVELRGKSSVSPPKWLVKIVSWLKVKFGYDRSTGLVGAGFLLFAFGLFLMLLCLTLWTMGSLKQGQHDFQKSYCSYKKQKVHDVVYLPNNERIEGHLLWQSPAEKQSMILNASGVYTILGDPPKLVSTTQFDKPKCQ
jgi:hypothetical protein